MLFTIEEWCPALREMSNVEDVNFTVAILNYIHKLFDTPSFKRWNSPAGSVGWTE